MQHQGQERPQVEYDLMHSRPRKGGRIDSRLRDIVPLIPPVQPSTTWGSRVFVGFAIRRAGKP